MKLDSLSFFSRASERMDWLVARQNVIAENIANADTPGFKARDVQPFPEMLQHRAASGGLTVTAEKHIPGGHGAVHDVRTVDDVDAAASSINGNSVVLEQQAIKANEVSENYALAARLYRKGYELLTLSVTGQK